MTAFTPLDLAVLILAYCRGEIQTAYALLEGRFGTGTRRFTSSLFW